MIYQTVKLEFCLNNCQTSFGKMQGGEYSLICKDFSQLSQSCSLKFTLSTMDFVILMYESLALSLFLLRYSSMYSEANDCLWSFGYGSNMDVTALEAKKGVKVIGNFFLLMLVIDFMHVVIFQSMHQPFCLTFACPLASLDHLMLNLPMLMSLKRKV